MYGYYVLKLSKHIRALGTYRILKLIFLVLGSFAVLLASLVLSLEISLSSSSVFVFCYLPSIVLLPEIFSIMKPERKPMTGIE